MGKIEKDQFEKYLEQNNPLEEPSPAVFQRLQKEAVWNQKPSSSKNIVLAASSVLIIGLLLMVSSYLTKAEAPKVQKLDKKRPVLEETVPERLDVIASSDVFKDKGAYRFMRCDSDDFNLSFEEDSSGQTRFGISRELDSI